MGFFSWETSDTHKSISNRYSIKGALPVYVLCPDGSSIYEDNYEGYGDFGGRDIYALLALWNTPGLEDTGDDDSIRQKGIDIAFSGKPIKYPIKIVENGRLDYNEVAPSKDCDAQGYFYGEDDDDDW